MSTLKEMYAAPKGYEWVTGGDSTALLRTVAQKQAQEPSSPRVELRAARGPGPSTYRSDAQAQRDYDDLIAEENTRKERARQRDILYDLAGRVASAAPWLEDLEDATGLDAPYLVDKAAEFAGPGDAFNLGRHALTAMPWFFTSKRALESGAVRNARKAFQRQSVLDAADDPAGMLMRQYVDDDLAMEPRYGIQDEGYVLPDEDAPLLFKTARERQDHDARLELKARAADQNRNNQILSWALGPDLGPSTPELRPYISKERREAAASLARQEEIRAAYEAALRQELEDEALDYASRFKGMPADEVIRSYVDTKRRYLNSEGGPAADATRLYKLYPPAE